MTDDDLSISSASRQPNHRQDPPRLYILDPGKVGVFGHQLVLNELIRHYGSQKGFQPHTLIHQNSGTELVARLSARAALSFDIYGSVPGDPAQTRRKLDEINALAFEETNAAIPDLGDCDLVVLHTVNQWCLSGVARWASQFQQSGAKFRILLRFPPAYSSGQGILDADNAAVLQQACCDALEHWLSLDMDVQVFVDSVELATHYQKLINRSFPIVPISIHFGDYEPSPPVSEDPDPVFLFAGNGRKEKGVLLLPDAIRSYYDQGGKGRFVIQAISNKKIARLFNDLEPHVTILQSHFDAQSFFQFLELGNVILVPYDPESYAGRTSHILIEALGCGRSVITSGGTWMEDQLNSLSAGSGIVMEDYSSDALAKACLAFCEHRAQLTRSAWQNAAHVRAQHNENVFLSVFLGFSSS